MSLPSAKFEDLPNEIIITVMQQLNTVDRFNLRGLNTRLDNILFDSIVTRHLSLFKYLPNDRIVPLDETTLYLYCAHILPHIRTNIRSLGLDSIAIEPVFTETTYPNLHNLDLHDINYEIVQHIFNSKKFDIKLFV